MNRSLITLLFITFTIGFSNGQITYRSKYRTALYLETFAISPIVSLNLESTIKVNLKSFLAFRAGFGYVPGARDVVKKKFVGSGTSYPASATYNFVLNNMKKRIYRRVSTKCKAAPAKISAEWFGEIGAGYSFLNYEEKKDDKNYLWGIIGLRQQVVFDIPPKPRVVFLRLQYTPRYVYSKTGFSFNDLQLNPISFGRNSSFGVGLVGMSLGFSI